MVENFSLQGRRALVTGAGTGIGRAIARALRGAGATLAITDLDLSAAEAVAAELGEPAIALGLDVTDAAATGAVVREVRDRLGGLEIVCANAGVSTMRPVVDLSEAEWDHNFAVNAKGVFLTNQAAVRCWLEAGVPGVIVNTASLAGKMAAPLLAHYSASKFAVVGFTQALAREVAAKGIRVNCVCPGLVRTSMQAREVAWEAGLRAMSPQAVLDEYVAMTPLGRLEEPEDVADAVVFLASDAARFITGEALNVTGGVRMD
jgi:meso-butanediol dehydrogenase / (S,S)-butanediol dehydrogenase / diacetyl reductase